MNHRKSFRTLLDLCKMCGECREWQQCDSRVQCPMTEDSWVPVSVLLDLSANEGANVVLRISALHDADETSVDMAEIDILNHVAAIYHNLDQHSLWTHKDTDGEGGGGGGGCMPQIVRGC